MKMGALASVFLEANTQFHVVVIVGERTLGPSGCCSEMPQTGWLINNTHIFLLVLEPGKSRITAPADSVFSKSCLVHRPCHLAVSLHCGRDKDALWRLFY